MTQTDYDPPLAGVRVLDLSSGPMVSVSRMLADLGAEVLRVELKGVTKAVPFGPVVDGIEVTSALATLGMPSIAIDLSAEGAAQQWSELLGIAGIVIESTAPGSAEEKLLDATGIRAAHPHIVVLSISDFGRDTRYAKWKGSSPVFHALTSELSRTGDPGREPLLPPGDLPYETAAAHAVLLTLAVYLDSIRSGHGERIDFSILEGAAAALDPAFGMAGSAAMGESLAALPRGRTDENYKYPIIPCKDGYARICVLAKRQWQGMFEWMGRPEQFADPKYDSLFARFSSPDLIPAIGRFFADKTRAEIEEQAQRYGVPAAAVLSVEEALQTPQVIARGFLRELEFARGLTAAVPVGVMEIDGVRASALNAPGPQPPADTHVQAGLASAPAKGLPLAGLKVVDFGIIIVGGDSTRILADLGADVIRVENSAFPDGARASLPAGEMKPGFASGHRNKRSIALNLQDPDGIRLAHRLIEDADIVFSNWKPGTKEKLGLDFASLKSINPRIVVVDSSAFGPTGPWSQRLGYGPLVRAATGFTEQWVYPDAPGRFQDDITVYPDHVSARISDILALALLVRRARTGLGGEGSNSQAEVMMSHMIPGLVAESLIRGGHTLTSPGDDAPWGVFPAKGDDDWIVVTVRDDEEWRGLARMIERKDLLADPDLATAAGRRAQRDRIHRAVAAWTRTRPAADGMELLQAAGVPAGAMLRGAELPEWDLNRKRDAYREETHPFANEPFTLENTQIHGERIAEPPRLPAPMLGEHTTDIARDVLGLTEAQISDLIERGVLEAPLLAARV